MGCLASFPLSCWVLIWTIRALNDIKGLDACVFLYIYLEDVCVSVKLCVRAPAELKWDCVWDVSCAGVCSPPACPLVLGTPAETTIQKLRAIMGDLTGHAHRVPIIWNLFLFLCIWEPSPSLPHPCFLSSNLISLGVSSPVSFSLLESVIMNIGPYMGGIHFLIMSSK